MPACGDIIIKGQCWQGSGLVSVQPFVFQPIESFAVAEGSEVGVVHKVDNGSCIRLRIFAQRPANRLVDKKFS
jgi:hypothetical protein